MEDEVYGGEGPRAEGAPVSRRAWQLPEEAEGDMDGDQVKDGDDEGAELEAMKARLREMEEEAAKLRQMQAKVEKEMGALPGGAADAANREEADARSVFVGNVDYAVTPEELQLHFASCGTVNRVTILTDKAGGPKGFAYVEFLEPEAVANAVLLSDSELHARAIKVVAKRTNVPGLKARRPGGRGRGGFDPYYGGGYGGRGRGRFGGRGQSFGRGFGRGRGYRGAY